MASMQGCFRPSHKPKPHMLAGPLCFMQNIVINIDQRIKNTADKND